jgi:uncharacterized membrane protein
VIAQMRAGEAVDPRHGQRAKQRSVHNTYFTLPVLVAMLSNHYGWLTQSAGNWLVLLVLMLAGALIRHSFVARHKALVEGRRVPWEHAVAGTVLLVGLAVALAPARRTEASASGPVDPVEVTRIIEQRCVVCHNAAVANKGVQLHEPALIQQHAQAIHQQAVVLRTMPLNNATGITEDERAVLGRWYAQGAQAR